MEHKSAVPEFKKAGLDWERGQTSPAQYCAHLSIQHADKLACQRKQLAAIRFSERDRAHDWDSTRSTLL